MSPCKCSAAALVAILLLPNVAASADPAAEAGQKGRSCLSRQDYDAAIAAFTEAIRLDPKKADAYYGRGVAYANQGQYDKEIADCTKAIRLDRKYVAAYYCRGVA
ncbi:MAG: tetratricopeptide repeat protein, partial [Thermoguttaceae bacterium]